MVISKSPGFGSVDSYSQSSVNNSVYRALFSSGLSQAFLSDFSCRAFKYSQIGGIAFRLQESGFRLPPRGGL